MTKIQIRIKELEDLRQELLEKQLPVTRESYLALLRYHIKLCTEVAELHQAFQNDDIKHIENWFNERSQ